MDQTEDNGFIAASATNQLLVLQLDQQFTASLYCPVRLGDVTEFNRRSEPVVPQTLRSVLSGGTGKFPPSSCSSFPPPLQSMSHTGHHM